MKALNWFHAFSGPFLGQETRVRRHTLLVLASLPTYLASLGMIWHLVHLGELTTPVAWGITLATAPQVQAAYHFGVRRVIMANQLVGRANMAIISRLLQNPEFDFFVIVDSAVNIEQLGQFFAQAGQRLNLLGCEVIERESA